MASLSDLPELVGFFSYSRDDDADSDGALSALRNRIQGELRGQLGRTAKTFRLWQDKEAIPSGTLWETEIRNAVGQSVFFIPIITPTVMASPHCKFELESFLAREAGLGRDDLIFPLLYIDVPGLEDSSQQQNNPVLSVIAKRQYVDWRKLRHRDVRMTDTSEAVERLCTHIRDALRLPWLSPEERRQKEANEAHERAERAQVEAFERQKADAHWRAREDAERRRRAEEEQRREAELERRASEADVRQRADGAGWSKQKAEEQKRTNEEGRQQASSEVPVAGASTIWLAALFLVAAFVRVLALGSIFGKWEQTWYLARMGGRQETARLSTICTLFAAGMFLLAWFAKSRFSRLALQRNFTAGWIVGPFLALFGGLGLMLLYAGGAIFFDPASNDLRPDVVWTTLLWPFLIGVAFAFVYMIRKVRSVQ